MTGIEQGRCLFLLLHRDVSLGGEPTSSLTFQVYLLVRSATNNEDKSGQDVGLGLLGDNSFSS